MDKIKIVIIMSVIAVGVGIVGFFLWRQSAKPGPLDGFAKCLADKGVKFYGAFWCPHCQNQKTLFGSSKKYLPYIECSTPDGNKQLEICAKANINSYPTWEFADGSKQEGEISLRELSGKSGCELP